MNNSNPQMIRFPLHGDDRGHLVIIEQLKEVPFQIKRIFYIFGSDANVVRGQHANRNSEFVLVNLCGTSKVKTDDGLGNLQVFELKEPHVGVYIPRMVWKDMYDFSSDSILLCIASETYDPDEYIRNYESFVKERN